MVREGATVVVSFDFTAEGTSFKGSFTSETQRIMEYPLDTVRLVAPTIHFELGGGDVVFDGEVKGDSMAGAFKDGGDPGTFALHRAAKASLPYRPEEVHFQNGSVVLSGTLCMPLRGGPHPAVVLLQGSGPESRWGASRLLADRFARQGIAALIYDKRGVGSSTGDWKRSTFEDLADDATAGIHMLQRRADINSRRVGIYGHSQGGSIAPLVAVRSRDVAFVISAAGGGVPMYEAEINSLTNAVRGRGVVGDDLVEATAFIQIFVNVARTGQGWSSLEAAVDKARDTKWSAVLSLPPKEDYWWSFFRQIADYDPAVYWEKVTVPALILQAEEDANVPVAVSVANIGRALTRAGNKDYTMLIFPRAQHNFSINPEPGQPFAWPQVAPGFFDVLTAWINQRMRP